MNMAKPEQFNQSADPEHYCVSELAPLYALGLLSPAEQQWLEQQLDACSELAGELANCQMAVAAIPYGLEALPSAARVRPSNLSCSVRLGLAAPVPDPAPNRAAAFTAVRSGDLVWQPVGIPKVLVATLHVDADRRERVGLLRAEPGMQYPPHTHGGTAEEIYMLSGDLVLEGVRYEAGDHIRSAPQSHHSPAHSVTGCMFFFRSSLDDQYPG